MSQGATVTVTKVREPDPRLETRKLGMWLFLVSEVMLFSALIGALMSMKARSPAGVNEVLNIPVTAVNTFILIVSSTAVVMALSAMEDGLEKKARNYMIATLALGAAFLGIQVFEYAELLSHGFAPDTNLFSGAFYSVTGLHGFHVFIGLCWLVGLLIQQRRGRLPVSDPVRFEIFGLYWHFVDVVWIVIFTLVYLL
jgi:heme/copper-type cytochrome/quinol oxidase subunit 3